jgi:hypothetical protein
MASKSPKADSAVVMLTADHQKVKDLFEESVAAKAEKVAGVSKVENQLEVAKPPSRAR